MNTDRVGPSGNIYRVITRIESISYRRRFRVEVILSSHVESLVSREWIVAKFFVDAHACGFLLFSSSECRLRLPPLLSSLLSLPIFADSSSLLFFLSSFSSCSSTLEHACKIFYFITDVLFLGFITPCCPICACSSLGTFVIRDYCFVFPVFYALVRNLTRS